MIKIMFNVIHLVLVCMMHKTQQAPAVCINCTMIVVFFANAAHALRIKFRIKIEYKNVPLPPFSSISYYVLSGINNCKLCSLIR